MILTFAMIILAIIAAAILLAVLFGVGRALYLLIEFLFLL